MRISDWSSDVCLPISAVAELLVQRPLGTGGHVESLAEGDAGLFAFRGVADGIGTEEEGGAVAAGCFPARAVDAQGAGRQRRAEAEVSSEAGRGGKAGVRPCRFRWSASHSKKKTIINKN